MPVQKFIRILIGIALIIANLGTGQVKAMRTNLAARVEVLYSGVDGLVLEMEAPEYQLEQVFTEEGNYDRISLVGADSTMTPGEPQLPVLNVLIGVPAAAEIRVEVLDDRSSSISGSYNLIPGPSRAGAIGDIEISKFNYVPNPSVYEAEALYPTNLVRVEEDGWFRDQRVVRIAFYPVQYNPAARTLLWHQQLRIKVVIVGGGQGRGAGLQDHATSSKANLAGSNHPFEPILKESLLNYETAKAWRSLEAVETVGSFSAPNLQHPAAKIVVNQDGLYRIRYEDLQEAGMDLEAVDPRYFRMTSQGQDVAIQVVGAQEDAFNPGDTITFYGEAFRGNRMAQMYGDEDQLWLNQFIVYNYKSIYFDAQLNDTMFEKYTDENVYWLTVDNEPGLRMEEVDGSPGEGETITTYRETIHEEESHLWWSWHFSDEDTWLWEKVTTDNQTPVITKTFTTTLTALASGSYSATVRGEVIALTYNDYATPDHHTQFYLNSPETLINEANWDGFGEYAFEAQTSQTNLLEGENQFLFVARDTVNMARDIFYFDWFEIEYERQLEATANQLTFSATPADPYRYQSHGFTNDNIEIYDITTVISPTRILSPTVSSGVNGTYTVTFETMPDSGARFFLAAVGDSAVIQSPVSITMYTPQDLSATMEADYVLISHRDFLTATQTLADYRSAQGLSTLVVDIDELYNQFNFGIYNPIAIKNFLAYAFATWTTPPSYAVLVGSGHWDMHFFKDTSTRPLFMPPNLAFVDPWQGEVDSVNLLATIVGDDILPDLAIGRLPVDSEQELYNVIQKIMTFEAASDQDWQRNLVFVADNIPDSAGDFIASNEAIINNHLAPGYQPIRIYENDFGCTVTGSDACKAVTTAITNTLNTSGTLLITYSGHGDRTGWSGERILKNSHLPTFNNGMQPAIFVDMTCLTGYWNDPVLTSLAKNLVTLENGGAVSTFSPTGLGVGQGHDQLLTGFYDALFKSGIRDLGSATLAAKLRLFQAGYSYDLIHTYTIFGDPALKVPIIQTFFFPIIQK